MKKTSNLLTKDFEYIYSSKLPWSELENSKILITGATGLIGMLLIKYLSFLNSVKNYNIQIIALARNEDKAKLLFEDSKIKLLIQDIKKTIPEDISADYIIHCAAVTKSIEMIQNPVDNLRTIIYGTDNILEFSRKNKIKSMVNLSSMEAYGVTNLNLEKTTEKDLGWIDLNSPRSSYSEGKRTGEVLCNSFYSQYDIPAKIARLAQTFGAGVSFDDTRVFAQFGKSVVNKENIIMHTRGTSMGNYCYTADAVKGIMFLLLKGTNGETYNIVNENNTMCINDMAKLVCREIASDKISIIYDIPENNFKLGYAPEVKMKLSAEKIKNLGWEPMFDMKNMYKRMIDYWHETE